jgi:signal transduction histidine kinase
MKAALDAAAESGTEAERQRDLLELACSTAGIGIFERDLRTGQSVWNQRLFEMRGLQGDSAAPPFEAAAARVVDSDRAHFDAAMRGSLLPRCDPVRQQHFLLRYRVLAPDDSVRYLHKQWIVRYGPDGRAQQMRGTVLDETPYQMLLQERSEAAPQRLPMRPPSAAAGRWMPSCAIAAEPAAGAACSLDGGVQAGTPAGAPTLLGVAIDASEQSGAADPPTLAATAMSNTDDRYRFLARLSHELRTPMNAVLGLSELLSFHDSGAPDASPARQRALNLITMSGEHMLALIDDVMDLSRLQGGEMRVQLETVVLEAVAASAVAMLDLPRQERRIALQTSGLELCVLADATRLRQVFLNLIGNAIKYGREGGRLVVEAERQADGVHLRISDDGQGMTAEQLLHLFEPFNRLGAENTAIEGTGLGLSISKMLIERMGGTVSVQSQPGRGTTFDVVLLSVEP